MLPRWICVAGESGRSAGFVPVPVGVVPVPVAVVPPLLSVLPSAVLPTDY
jgi:hypothetical protein